MNFQLHGHRGARGWRAENTLAGIEYALARGVDGVEVDVCITADGVVVLHHDLHTNPNTTRDANGDWLDARIPICELSYDELRKFDVGRLKPHTEYAARFAAQVACDGARVPSLEECADVMRRWGQRCGQRDGKGAVLNIELKSASSESAAGNSSNSRLTPPVEKYAAIVAEKIAAFGISPPAISVFVQSFDWALMRAFDAAAQSHGMKIPSGYIIDCPYSLADAEQVKQFGAAVFSCNYRGLSAELVRAIHALDLRVCAWTVNDQSAIARLREWGVDIVTTDYP